MHNLELLAQDNGVFSFDKASMVIVEPLLLMGFSRSHSLLRGNPLEWCIVIFVLVAPKLTDEAPILPLLSLGLPADVVNLLHLEIGHS